MQTTRTLALQGGEHVSVVRLTSQRVNPPQKGLQKSSKLVRSLQLSEVAESPREWMSVSYPPQDMRRMPTRAG